ncbi:MAG: hypothetical protein Q9162_001032 [Coniocarpon cinnabarinum]
MSSPMQSPNPASWPRARPHHSHRKFRRRKVQEPCISATSAQSRRTRRRSFSEPQLQRWRNNLTALSHFHNLYVVAYQDELHVYEPQYPLQIVPKYAPLIMRLPVSSPSLRGYIDDQNGHFVNHIVIGELGDQEIVLCSCDDGDVLAFYVDSIVKAMQRRAHANFSSQPVTDEVQPFFHVNVKMSAWGLAIHKQARVIAVSSNTRIINVFAFALSEGQEPGNEGTDNARHKQSGSDFKSNKSNDTNNESNSHEGWVSNDVYAIGGWYHHCPSSSATSQAILETRNVDVCVRLEGHGHNIPTVAFCNTGADPQGRFLTSADIRGCLFVWDIYTCQPLRVFMPPPSRDMFGLDPASGWGVHWLDPRSFWSAEPRRAFRYPTEFYAEMQGDVEVSAVNLAGPKSMDDPTQDWNPSISVGMNGNHSQDDETSSDVLPDVLEPVESPSEQSDDGSQSSPQHSRSHHSRPRLPSSRSRQSSSQHLVPSPRQSSTPSTPFVETTGSAFRSWQIDWPSRGTVLVQKPSSSPSTRSPPSCPLFLSRMHSLCLFQSPQLQQLSRSHPFTVLDDPLEQDVGLDCMFTASITRWDVIR